MGDSSANRVLIVRVDANSKIGVGHAMRCIALGQACYRREVKIIIVGSISSIDLIRKIKEEGFSYIPLASNCAEKEDLKIINELIKKNHDREVCIVLDGYHFSSKYCSILKNMGRKLLIVDDNQHLSQYHADIILNQNSGAERLRYNVANSDARSLLGARYTLLRNEFIDTKWQGKVISGSAKRIVVSFGGADPNNISLLVVEALREVVDSGMEVRIVLGPVNHHKKSLEKAIRQLPCKAHLITDSGGMAPLFSWADLVVSSAGSTCWELSYLGVPSLVIILADNQRVVAELLEKKGAAVNCGWHADLSSTTIVNSIKNLINSEQHREKLSQNGQKLIDGAGGSRIAEHLFPTRFSFVKVGLKESRLIYEWANDPRIRQASFSSESINWEDHQKWFNERLAEKKNIFWLARNEQGEAAGQVRFDLKNDSAEVSVSVNPQFIGLGLGVPMLRQACQKLLAGKNVNRIEALIKQENAVSQRAFRAVGFHEDHRVVRQGVDSVVMSYSGEG